MQTADTVEKPKTPEEELREVTMQITYFEHLHTCAVSRKARAEKLMGHKAAKRWDAPKKQQMVRRLTRADQEMKQSADALTRLHDRLLQLKSAGHAVVLKRHSHHDHQ